MAQLYIGVGNSTSSWGGGSYNGAGLLQEFPMPYDAAKLNPADGKFYADVQYISTYLSGYQSYALATYRNWFIASTTQRNFTLVSAGGAGYRSAAGTVSGTTSVERKLAITVGPIGYTTAPVYAMGFQITNSNYWNQFYDATGTTDSSHDMYYVSTGNVGTNTNSTVAKWGGGANWEAAANLASRCYYNTLPTAPAVPTSGTATSTDITLSVSVPSDDGAGNGSAGTDITAFRVRYSSNGGTSWAGTQDFTKTATTQNVTVTGLTSNTNYVFQVAAINSVATQIGSTASGPYSASSSTIRTLLDAPTVTGSYTSTATVNVAYSSNPTWTQSAGGGAAASTLTYSISSGSLTGSGLSLNTSTGTISGTPTIPGSYTFTVRAQNADYVAGSRGYVESSQTITVGTLGPLVVPTNGGTATTRSTAKVWNGTSFVNATVMVYDGTTPYSSSGWKYLK